MIFTTLIVKPIFNLLVLIYGILPGHNFGLSVIIFTVIVRLLLWPLIRKQLHQAKAMKKLQPEIKKIKASAKGDRTKESQMTMELYKERGINPFATFPTLIIQLIVLIGLYSGLRKVIDNPSEIVTFAYPSLQHLPWLKHLANHTGKFDDTLFGVVNLSRAAIGKVGGIYFPAMLLVLGSAVAQYFQSQQLLPTDKNARSLRAILKEAGNGTQADQSEVNAAVGRGTKFFLPVIVFFFTVNLASALSLYWLTGGIVAYIQQSIILREDENEMEAEADTPTKKDVSKIQEAEIVEKKPNNTKKAVAARTSNSAKKSTSNKKKGQSKGRKK